MSEPYDNMGFEWDNPSEDDEKVPDFAEKVREAHERAKTVEEVKRYREKADEGVTASHRLIPQEEIDKSVPSFATLLRFRNEMILMMYKDMPWVEDQAEEGKWEPFPDAGWHLCFQVNKLIEVVLVEVENNLTFAKRVGIAGSVLVRYQTDVVWRKLNISATMGREAGD